MTKSMQDIISLPRSKGCREKVKAVKLTSGREGDNKPSTIVQKAVKKEYIADAITDDLVATGVDRNLIRGLLLGRQLAMLELVAMLYTPELEQLPQDDKTQLSHTKLWAGEREILKIWEGKKVYDDAAVIGRYGVIIKFLVGKMGDAKGSDGEESISAARQNNIYNEIHRERKNSKEWHEKEVKIRKILFDNIVLSAVFSISVDRLGGRIFQEHALSNILRFQAPYLEKDTIESDAHHIIDPEQGTRLDLWRDQKNQLVDTQAIVEMESKYHVHRAHFMNADQNIYGLRNNESKIQIIEDAQLQDEVVSEILYAMMKVDLENQINKEGISEQEKAAYQAKLNLLEAVHSLKDVVDSVMEVEGAATERLMKPKVERAVKTVAVASAGVLVAGAVFISTMEIGSAAEVTGVEVGAITKAIFGASDSAHVMQMAGHAAPILIFCAALLGIAIGIGGVSAVAGYKVYNRPDPAIVAQDLLDNVAKGNVDLLKKVKDSLQEVNSLKSQSLAK